MHKKILFLIFIISGINYADAVTFTQNTSNACNFIANTAYFVAEYDPKEYTCNAGYYLPANHEGCVQCPSMYTCAGGTFTFNENAAQGIVYSDAEINTNINNMCAVNIPRFLSASFTPNTHTCSSGQYLPAGVDSCAQCPANSYCVGGTFTFNETTDQGIESCANGYSAPAGSSTCSPNTITVRWDDGNGGAYTTTCSYGGTLTTPSTPPVAPKGYHFTGWSFDLGN